MCLYREIFFNFFGNKITWWMALTPIISYCQTIKTHARAGQRPPSECVQRVGSRGRSPHPAEDQRSLLETLP